MTDSVDACEIPADTPFGRMLRASRSWPAPDDAEERRILESARSIAIVGASSNPERASYGVAKYLQDNTGYRLFFVNPNATEILGEPAYPDLASLPETPDIVDVFRRLPDVPGVVDDAIAAGAKAVWLQLDLWDEDAARKAQDAGLDVVMDRCIKVEHAKLFA